MAENGRFGRSPAKIFGPLAWKKSGYLAQKRGPASWASYPGGGLMEFGLAIFKLAASYPPLGGRSAKS